jgi:hypothetical protein
MSEYLRVKTIQDQQRRCDAAAALARAQNLYGNQACASCRPVLTQTQVQLESQLLTAKMATCTAFVRAPPVPESARIAALIQNVVYESTNPTNPTTRFSEYVRFFPAPCPPPDTLIVNASLPKASTGCQLPNGPFNPVLPA